MIEDFGNENNSFGMSGKFNELDLPKVLFLQLNRINYLFSEFYSGDPRSAMATDHLMRINIFGAISVIEPIIVSNLSEKHSKEYSEEKTKTIKLIPNNKPEGSCTYMSLINWYSLLTQYLFKTNLLPKKRVSYQTGDDK
jgi:hypothetical protein